MQAARNEKLGNAEVGGEMSAPRRKLREASTREAVRRACKQSVCVCVPRGCLFASRKGGKGRMRACGRQYGPHTLPFPCSLSHAQSPARARVCTSVSLSTCTHTQVRLTRVGARTCSSTERKYVPGFYRRSEQRERFYCSNE